MPEAPLQPLNTARVPRLDDEGFAGLDAQERLVAPVEGVLPGLVARDPLHGSSPWVGPGSVSARPRSSRNIPNSTLRICSSFFTLELSGNPIRAILRLPDLLYSACKLGPVGYEIIGGYLQARVVSSTLS